MFDYLSILTPEFILYVFAGAAVGLFIGAIPGLSVPMALALLVSLTYTWDTKLALAAIMGVFVVGVFSGAISAILVNIPGTSAAVCTTLDGYPLAQRGESYKALYYATIYSFFGTLFGFAALVVVAKPISKLALSFTPMDYFLLALFGLVMVGTLTSENFIKGMISAMLGLLVAMVGMDPIVGGVRLSFGIAAFKGGISMVPVLIGLFGFAEVLTAISSRQFEQNIKSMKRSRMSLREVLNHWNISIPAALIGTVVGALPGAGGPVAAFMSYTYAKKRVKNPEVPFGEGAVEGIIASETANNACIGGALIPMLTLAVPGDSVTAIMLAVFYIHGLNPGPMFVTKRPDMFATILIGGLVGCVAMLIYGLLIAPRISKVILIPKRIMLPIITVLCMIGAFASNSRLFDVALMFAFGLIGFAMRRFGFGVSPMLLGVVLGSVMDSNIRRAITLYMTDDHMLLSMFGHPITIVLTLLILCAVGSNIPAVKRIFKKSR